MSTWLITGCSTGLGRALAEAVLASGHNAVVTARKVETLQDITAGFPDTALALPLDVTDKAQISAAVKAAEEKFGAEVMAAMQQLDPTAATKIARGQALPAEVEAARAANDNARLNALATEATELQNFFNGLRQRALATPEIQEKRKAYLAVVLAKMNEIDPQAQAMVDRLTALRNGGAAQQR